MYTPNTIVLDIVWFKFVDVVVPYIDHINKYHIHSLSAPFALNASLAHLFLQLTWVSETCTVLASVELAKDVSGAEEMIERHQELKTEMDTREEK